MTWNPLRETAQDLNPSIQLSASKLHTSSLVDHVLLPAGDVGTNPTDGHTWDAVITLNVDLGRGEETLTPDLSAPVTSLTAMTDRQLWRD